MPTEAPLSGPERRVFLAVAEAAGGSAVGDDVADAAAALVRHLSPGDRLQLRLLLRAVALAPVLHGRVTSFSALPREGREALLRAWAASPLAPVRQAASALRSLALLAVYGRPEAGGALGYDGPWLGRVPVAVLPAPSLESAGPYARGRAPGVHEPPRRASRDVVLRADACVIGTGAGGAAALARLAGALDVLAVEAGDHVVASDFTQRELEMLPLLYQEAGLRATADKGIAILQGRGVGGSTLHNTGLVYAPPPGIVERWREEHGFPQGDDALARRVAAVMETLGARRIPDDRINANNDALRRGADALGWRHRVALHNRVECCGCGYCMLGCAYNRKNNAALTFLPRAVGAGARILTGTRAVRIEGVPGRRRVVCDRLDAGGRRIGRTVVEAARVLVAAGALDTPALLRRSGLGGRWVGERLRLHPAALVHAVFAHRIEAWRGLPQSVVLEEFATFFQNGRGGFLVIAGASSWPGLTAAAIPAVGADHRRVMEALPNLASAAVLLHDETSGRVRAAGDGRPVARYWPDPDDRAELLRGVGALARLYLAAGAERVHLPFTGAPAASTDAEVNALVGDGVAAPHRIALASVHPQGSCAMGADPARSAADPYGRLWDAPDVAVCDASLFPTSVGVPPQVTIMALADAVAAAALERRS